MKTLSVRQPWATLIAMGIKTLEIRSRCFRYRGPLLIHAAKSRKLSADGQAACRRYGLDPKSLPRGVTVALCTLSDSRAMQITDTEAACCCFDPAAFAHVLDVVQAIPHIPMNGSLSLFDPPGEVLQLLQEFFQ